MRVTLLGTGTAVPDFDRFPSGALVQSDGLDLLVDLGPGTLRRLAQVGVSPAQIDGVLLTHFHTDHTADLAALLFALRNPAFRDRDPLRIYAARGLRRFVDQLMNAWPWLQPRPEEYDLHLEEIQAGVFEWPTRDTRLWIQAVPIRHTAQSLAYRLTGPDNASVAFSGDADVCDGLVQVARGAELFVCDCAFPDEQRQAGHLTPALAADAAQQAGVQTLCLTHFYPECEGVDLVAQAAAVFSGRIVAAEDLMAFELEPGKAPLPAATPRSGDDAVPT